MVIEIEVDGKIIIPVNGSCITVSEDGRLNDINYPDNVAFDPYQGMPDVDPIEDLPVPNEDDIT